MHRYTVIPAVFLLLAILFQSCGTSTETRVVDRAPQPMTELREMADDDGRIHDVLRVGSMDPIRSLDPLFARNTSSRQAVQLIYEGLVRFDENRNIEPGVARDWEVSDDSLHYTFTLHDELYFQDDESFTHGVGRRVRAEDVKWVFERMASQQVPPDAAELFMDHIAGFEDFVRERRELFHEEDRTLDEIRGIEAVDRQTIRFELVEPDPRFLERLASPYAVIYPREAVRQGSLGERPVGTGPFEFGNSFGDSLHVLQRNENYHRGSSQGAPLPSLQRVELLNTENHHYLVDQLNRGHLNMVIDPDPVMIAGITDEQGALDQDLQNEFELQNRGEGEPFTLHYNPDNRHNIDRSQAEYLLDTVPFDSLQQDFRIPDISFRFDYDFTREPAGVVVERFGLDSGAETVRMAHDPHRGARVYSEHIYNHLQETFNVELMQRHLITRDLTLYTRKQHRLFGNNPDSLPGNELVRFHVNRYIIVDHETSGVRTNDIPWWLDLTEVSVPEIVL